VQNKHKAEPRNRQGGFANANQKDSKTLDVIALIAASIPREVGEFSFILIVVFLIFK